MRVAAETWWASRRDDLKDAAQRVSFRTRFVDRSDDARFDLGISNANGRQLGRSLYSVPIRQCWKADGDSTQYGNVANNPNSALFEQAAAHSADRYQGGGISCAGPFEDIPQVVRAVL